MTQSRQLLILPLLSLSLGALALLSGCATGPQSRSASSSQTASSGVEPISPSPAAAASATNAAAVAQVVDTERAFAQTMADRNLKGFLTFLSPDSIFFSGQMVEHGVAEIANVWAPFFNGPRAPFLWQPDHVEVTADGRLALSTGPILQQGKAVARFTSIWRLEGKAWHIVFDKGEPVCSAPARGSS
jgi:ketosteroid isomerase-like protein